MFPEEQQLAGKCGYLLEWIKSLAYICECTCVLKWFKYTNPCFCPLLSIHTSCLIHHFHLILPLSSQSDPLSLVAHDFFFHSASFPPCSFAGWCCVCVCVFVCVFTCEVVISTVRLARHLCVRLVWRKIMEALSADQQRLDEVTAKL